VRIIPERYQLMRRRGGIALESDQERVRRSRRCGREMRTAFRYGRLVGMTDEELTVSQAMALLEARGFTGSFHVATETSTLVCDGCRQRVVPSDAEVIEVFRFEGASDPGDEAIVVGLRCRTCGQLGILVSAYGAEADASEAEVLAALGDARFRRP